MIAESFDSRSECFGLLGLSGTARTSIFRILTGELPILRGQTWVRGMSLSNAQQMIGYCPRVDAFLGDLTARETLEIIGLLRGVRRNQVATISQRLAKNLHFVREIDKRVDEYSDSEKRKLSMALALIGDPAVVFLEDPTIGLDRTAKRQLWNVICKLREEGKSIVLTSNDMEEYEALCTRCGIMANGELKCLGSIQHLKDKFSDGFKLIINVARAAES